jgi:hypothetical protein
VYVDNNLVVSGSVSAAGVIGFQTVTGASAVLSTNTIDLGVARDIGAGEDVHMRVEVGTVFAGLTALDIEVISADDAALSVNVTSLGAEKAIPVASLTAGARFDIAFGAQLGKNGRRYLGARYTPTGTGTTGTLFADFGVEVQDSGKGYASGFAVI